MNATRSLAIGFHGQQPSLHLQTLRCRVAPQSAPGTKNTVARHDQRKSILSHHGSHSSRGTTRSAFGGKFTVRASMAPSNRSASRHHATTKIREMIRSYGYFAEIHFFAMGKPLKVINKLFRPRGKIARCGQRGNTAPGGTILKRAYQSNLGVAARSVAKHNAVKQILTPCNGHPPQVGVKRLYENIFFARRLPPVATCDFFSCGNCGHGFLRNETEPQETAVSRGLFDSLERFILYFNMKASRAGQPRGLASHGGLAASIRRELA